MERPEGGALRKAWLAWREVLALYGDVMCSAQILEGELLQILYFLRIPAGELTEPSFDWAYRRMLRMSPREVLDSIRGAGGNLSNEHQQIIEKAVTARNFLAHAFFHKYNPVMTASQCERVISRLRERRIKAEGCLRPAPTAEADPREADWRTSSTVSAGRGGAFSEENRSGHRIFQRSRVKSVANRNVEELRSGSLD
jgi:hypothetical protein